MADPSGQWIVRDLQTTQSDLYVEITPTTIELQWNYVSFMRCTRADGALREGVFDTGIVRGARANSCRFIYNSSMSEKHGMFEQVDGRWTWQSLNEPFSGPLLSGWPDVYPACKS